MIMFLSLKIALKKRIISKTINVNGLTWKVVSINGEKISSIEVTVQFLQSFFAVF